MLFDLIWKKNLEGFTYFFWRYSTPQKAKRLNMPSREFRLMYIIIKKFFKGFLKFDIIDTDVSFMNKTKTGLTVNKGWI